MQLTQFTDYSLRVLIYLAKHRGALSTITDIALWHDASKPHLVKVVHHLSKLGYIETVRGKGGGLCLKMEPNEINIGAVVRACEPHFDIVECFDAEKNTCRLAGGCGLQSILHRATDHFLKELDAHTLETITGQGG